MCIRDSTCTYPYTYSSILASRPASNLHVVPEKKSFKVPKKTVPKVKKYTDAPLLNLKDLLPPDIECDDVHDKDLDSTFRATRLEFILLAQTLPLDETLDPDIAAVDDNDLEWSIPDQDTFDDVVGDAVFTFTENEPTRIDTLAWSSTGWDTGVGLIALTTDNLKLVEDFRSAISMVDHPSLRFITLPKQMLIKKYALTVLSLIHI